MRLILVVLLFLGPIYLGQELGDDVDNLTVTNISPQVVRFSWTSIESVECESTVTYSVYPGISEDFHSFPEESDRERTYQGQLFGSGSARAQGLLLVRESY